MKKTEMNSEIFPQDHCVVILHASWEETEAQRRLIMKERVKGQEGFKSWVNSDFEGSFVYKIILCNSL